MNVRPLQDRVLIMRDEEETTTTGGIILTDTAKEKPIKGKVVAAGPGKKGETGAVSPLDVKVGDHIYFGKYAGTEIKIDGAEYLIMREEDIMAIIEEK